MAGHMTLTLKIDPDLQTRLDELRLPEIQLLESETVELESTGLLFNNFLAGFAGAVLGSGLVILVWQLVVG